MKKPLLIFSLFVISILNLPKNSMAQNIGIGTITPNASAALDITSINKGLLMPRVTTTQKKAITNPAKGLMVYDSSLKVYSYYDGKAWRGIASDSYKSDSSLTVGNQTNAIASYNLFGNMSSSDSSGYLYDSGGPGGPYNINENFYFTIHPGGSIGININVLTNSLEPVFDSLIITDAYNKKYVLTGNTTGKFLLYGTVVIHFKSNFANEQQGFSIRWDKIYASTTNNYDSTQLSGWYFNPSRLYMRGGLNNYNNWSPDSSGTLSFSYGSLSQAKGDHSVALGSFTKASGYGSVAIGEAANATGFYAIAMGSDANASNFFSVAVGQDAVSSGSNAISIGTSTEASGSNSMAMGINAIASGSGATTMGQDTKAIGILSTATGYLTTANGLVSTAIGRETIANGENSIAIGYATTADGSASTAMGENTIASGAGSLAGGMNTKAIGDYSTAFGIGTQSKSFGGTVVGINNDATAAANATSTNPLNRIFQIGNGTDFFNRSNAMTVLQNGNIGIGKLNPAAHLVITGSGSSNQLILEDSVNNKIIRLSNDGGASGPYIGTSSNHDFSFISNNSVRAVITNSGTVDVKNNLTVQNGKGIIRNTDGTQKKQLSTTVTVNIGFAAGETKTFPIAWPESFSSVPDAFVGNIISGAGGWAEVVMTISGAGTTGATLYVYNPKTVAANPNFTVKIIATGPQ